MIITEYPGLSSMKENYFSWFLERFCFNFFSRFRQFIFLIKPTWNCGDYATLGKWYSQEEAEILGYNSVPVQLITHKPHTDRPWIEPEPSSGEAGNW